MSYFAIGAGSGGCIGGRDVSNRLSFAGDIVNGRMETVANSDLSIGIQHTDQGQLARMPCAGNHSAVSSP